MVSISTNQPPEYFMNVHSAYLAIIKFRGGVTDEDQRARRPAYIVYGLNHVSHARFSNPFRYLIYGGIYWYDWWAWLARGRCS